MTDFDKIAEQQKKKYLQSLAEIAQHQVDFLKERQFIVLPDDDRYAFGYICTSVDSVRKILSQYNSAANVQIFSHVTGMQQVSGEWFLEEFYDKTVNFQ